MLTITSAGRIGTDDTHTTPLTGTASDGTAYQLAQSGTATGTITASGGRISVTLDQPTPLTLTLSRNGTRACRASTPVPPPTRTPASRVPAW